MTNGSGENQVQFEAVINAESFEEFFSMMDSRMNALESTVDQGFETIDESVYESGQNIMKFSGLFTSVWMKVVNAIFQGVGAIKSFITGSISLRAEVDTLGVTLNLVGKNAGYSREEIAKYEEEVKGLGITTSVTRQSLIRLIQADIDLADATTLARTAQNLAQGAQMNSSQAYERMVIAIQRQEPELLDELLIQVDREAAYRRLAIQLDKNVDSLTKAEQQQAFMNEIIRKAAPFMGVYEEALGTVGKQITSLPRFIEEVQLALGGLFQPAEAERIGFYTETLIKLQTWFDENQDVVDQWAIAIGKATGLFFDFVEQIEKIPAAIQDAGIAIAKVFGDESEIDKNVDNMALHAQQAIALIAYSVGAMIGSMIAAAKVGYDIILGIKDLIAGGIGTDEFVRRIEESNERNKREAREFANSWIEAAIDVLPLLGETAEAIEDVADETENAAIKAMEFADSMDEARAMLDEFQEAAEKELELRILKESRDVIERALKKSFRVEDIERTHQERLDKIIESGEEKRDKENEQYDKAAIKAAKDHSKNLVRIERNYQRRLRDIQKDFEADSKELARRRDAVGLLELERRHNRQLEKEEEAHDLTVADAEEAYAEQKQAMLDSLAEQEIALSESLIEQLDAAEASRKKEYEALERSLDRQKQIRELHAEWEAEDRQTKYDEELEAIGTHLGSIEGLTEAGLTALLGEYEGFYDDVGVLWEAFFAAQTARAAQMVDMWKPYPGTELGPGPWASGYVFGDGAPSGIPGGPINRSSPNYSRSSPYGNYNPANYQPPPGDYYQYGPGAGGPTPLRSGRYGPGSTPWWMENEPLLQKWLGSMGRSLFGQAGQVSSLLAGSLTDSKPSIISPNLPSRLPASTPISSVDRREIHVTADLAGIDPHLQRVVLNTMLEIERNRG